MKYPISGKHVNGGIVPQLNTHPASHGSMAGRHQNFYDFIFIFEMVQPGQHPMGVPGVGLSWVEMG